MGRKALLNSALALAISGALIACNSTSQRPGPPAGSGAQALGDATKLIVDPFAILTMIADDLDSVGKDMPEHVAPPENLAMSVHMGDFVIDDPARRAAQPMVIARLTAAAQTLAPVIERLEPATRPALQLTAFMRREWLAEREADRAAYYLYPNASADEAFIAITSNQEMLYIYLSGPYVEKRSSELRAISKKLWSRPKPSDE